MAFGFIKKVFSFGKKQVEERPAEDEPLPPLNLDALKPGATPPSPSRGGSVGEADRGGVADEARDASSAAAIEPAPSQPETPAEPAKPGPPNEPDVPSPPAKPEIQPEPVRPEVVPEPAKPDVAPEPARPEIPAPAEPVVPSEPARPEVPQEPVTPEVPDEVAPAEVPEPPAETPPPSAAEVTPSGPPGHLPLKGGEDAEPTPPSPSRGGSVGEADRGGVADEARDASSPVARVAEEAPRAAETTPSGPPGHLPLKGGEDAEPTPPSPLRGGSVGEADRGGVADEARDASSPVARVVEEAPRAAEVTPSGPSGHLPLKGGEDAEPAAPGKVTVGKAVEKKAEPEPAAPTPEPRKSWFQRLRDGLSRSSRELTGSIAGIFTKRKLDEETLEELEDVLIRADLGMETALRVTDTLASSRYGKDVSDAEVRAIMAQEVEKVLGPVARPLELDLSHKPHVILVVGVNGTGKTTTIGKLAAKLSQGGLSVMLAAGDTFRAAAIEQLKIWGERTGSPVVSSKLGADAAGLAWDAFEKAREAGSDVLIIDTAGRLQNKAELMAELEKIVRVLGKHDPEAPHTVLQTVDATTGQNALNQVEIFRNVAGVNGLVMTKLDGTARGGILVAIAAKHKLPVYFIGVGEQVDDLEPFSAGDFAKAIAGVG